MIKINKPAFTLSEALITLSIVGVLAALVLPGLVKNSINQANIALLQSTVANLNDAIQSELIKNQITNIKDTTLYKDPRKFMRNSFDVSEECQAAYDTPCSGAKYTNYNGTSGGIFHKVPTLLANGVAIDFLNDNPAPHILVRIDLNGRQAPNVVGVDLFYLNIVGETDLKNSLQVGDVRGLLQDGINEVASTVTNKRLKQLCVSGFGTPCYLLLERSGFDPKYLEKSY
ncbi:type II secretion system protein [bacterium]|nr:type II secretion system protein [bacterium]